MISVIKRLLFAPCEIKTKSFRKYKDDSDDSHMTDIYVCFAVK